MSANRAHTLLAVSVLAMGLACSVAAVQPPASCHEDVECPADARCRQDTCTADIPPRASIAGPSTATIEAELLFDGAASSDADDGDISGYTWSVRTLSGGCAPELDGSGASTFRPVFACPGEYEVILVVRDGAGVVSDPAIAPLTIVAQ